MLYEVDVECPANTAAAAPTEVLARLPKGVVTKVAVQIPLGVKGLTGAQVWRGRYQVWPSNPGAYFKGDDVVIEWAENYELRDEPQTLRLRVWNSDDTFAHTVTFRFALVSLEQAERAGGGLLGRIADFLGV